MGRELKTGKKKMLKTREEKRVFKVHSKLMTKLEQAGWSSAPSPGLLAKEERTRRMETGRESRISSPHGALHAHGWW